MISARSGASRSYSLVALLAPGPLGRVSAELSRTVSFSDFATREMQLKRDQRERRNSSLRPCTRAAFLTYDSVEKRLAASWNAGFNIVQLRRCCIFTGSY